MLGREETAGMEETEKADRYTQTLIKYFNTINNF